MLTGNITFITDHRFTKAKNIAVHGRLIGGQLYTHPLILPDVDSKEPHATYRNLFQLAKTKDQSFISLCEQAGDIEISTVKASKHRQLNRVL